MVADLPLTFVLALLACLVALVKLFLGAHRS